MSEERSPSTDRWIPWLGLALLLAAVANSLGSLRTSLSTIQPNSFPWFFLLTRGFLPAALGFFMVVSHRQTHLALAAVRIAFAVIVGLIASTVVEMFPHHTSRIGLIAMRPVSMLLISIGTPILWGSALARLDHPSSPALQKFGRVSAGLVQLGFVFDFVTRVEMWGSMSSIFSSSGSAASALFGLTSVADVAASVALLWASVEAVRTPADDADVLRRARRSHRLLCAWLLLEPIHTLLFQVSFSGSVRLGPAAFTELGFALAQIAVYLTLAASTSFVLARWLRLQFPATQSPLERSNGAA